MSYSRKVRVPIPLILIVLLASLAFCENSISAAEAKNHLGENATVCGQVVSAHFAATSRGRPTFLNLDEPYPNQIFTIVIWGSDRAKFGSPESTYKGKDICASGPIESYRGVPQIVAHEAGQITAKRE
jgi:hypothetical protein